MMTAPESRQKLEDERSEPPLDRFGVCLVAWRLVRDRVGQERERERRFEVAVGLANTSCLNLVRSQNTLADEFSTGSDEWLPEPDLVFAQVAAEKADGRIQRAGVENGSQRVSLGLRIDGKIQRDRFAGSLMGNRFDQRVDCGCQPRAFLKS